MSVQAAEKAGKYTEEILNKNFLAISKEFSSIAQWQRHVEGHLDELYEFAHKAGQLAQAASKQKGLKTKHKVIIAVAIGIYVGRRSLAGETKDAIERIKREAQERIDAFVSTDVDPNADTPR